MRNLISELIIELRKSTVFQLVCIFATAVIGAIVGWLFTSSPILTTIIGGIPVVLITLYHIFKIWRRRKKEKEAFRSSSMKRHSRVRKWAVCCSVVIASLLLVSIVYLSNIKTSYYNTIVERFGLPYGIGDQLSSQEQSAMSDYWKIKENRFTHKITATFVTKSGPLALLDSNSTLYSMNVLRDPSSIVYTYTGAANKPTVLRAEYNKEGKTILRLDYQTDSGGNLSEIVNVTTYHGSEEQKLLQCYLFRVPANDYRALLPQATIAVQYNDDGLPRERMLLKQAMAYSAQNGVFGERYTYDSKGRLEQLTFLDENRNPKSLSTGAMSLRFSYTGYNQLLQICYYADDIFRTPIAYRGAPIHAFVYDENNYNLISRSFRDKDENPVSDQNGVYTYRYDYENLLLARESYLGANGQDIYVSQHEGSSKNYAFKSKDRIFQATVNRQITHSETLPALPDSTTVEDNATLNPFEFEAIYAIANTGDEKTEKGSPWAEDDYTFSKNTVSEGILEETGTYAFTTIYKLDKRGRITRVSYADDENLPITNPVGYAAIEYNYEKKSGNLAKMTYLNLEGKPFVSNGYSSLAYEYNDDGEMMKETYLFDKKPTINFNTWYSTRKIVYTKDKPYTIGSEQYISVKEQYLDADENAVYSKSGYQERLCLYDKNGLLRYELYCKADSNGSLTLNNDGYAGIKYTREHNRVVCEEHLDRNIKPTINYSKGYAVVATNYNKLTGQVERVRYFDADGKTPILDKTTGTSGYRNEFSGGNITKTTYFGLDGQQPIPRKDEGYAVLEQVYNVNNDLEWSFFYDVDGVTPVLNSTTWAAAHRIVYDEGSRKISERYYYGPREEDVPVSNKTSPNSWTPILNKTEGASRIHYEYDYFGNLVKLSYYGLDDSKLTLTKDGGYATHIQHYDNKNRYIGADYLDVNGNKILHKVHGYASIRRDLDDAGKLLGESYYGVLGKPRELGERILATNDKVAGYTYTYYTDGKMTGLQLSKRFFGVEGPENLILDNSYWAAEYLWEYDDFGRNNLVVLLDTRGYPTASRYSGYTSYEKHFDARGNNTYIYYYYDDGTDIKLVNLADTGYAYVRKTYNEDCTLESERYYGFNTDSPKRVFNTKTWCSGIRWKYDKFGRNVSVEYLDDLDQPTLHKDSGIAKYTIEYGKDNEDYGKETAYRYYDETLETLAPRKSGGYAIIKYDYKYRSTTTSYWINENEPCLNLESKKWYSSYIAEYDARGLGVKWTYLDAEGNPAVDGVYGDSQTLSTYNAWGEIDTQTYLDVNDEGVFVPVLRKDRGYAYIVNLYDGYGRDAGAEFYGTDCESFVIDKKTGAACYTQKLNQYGNVEEECYFGLVGEPTLREGGYSWIKRSYDNKQRMTGIEYFGMWDERVIGPDGFSSYTRSFYGATDFVEEIVYRGTDHESKPMIVRRDGWGYAVLRQKFNEHGLMTWQGLYNDERDPKLILEDNQYAQAEYEYDELGNRTKETYKDTHGDKIIMDDGYAWKESYYNGTNLVEEKIFDVNDNQLPISSSYYSRRRVYDHLGRLDTIEYLNKTGNRIADDDDYTYIRYQYNKSGNEKTERYFDTDGQPYAKFGFEAVSVRYSYDAMGREILKTYLNENGNFTENSNEYASLETKYNSKGLVASKEYRDLDENPVAVYVDDFKYARVEYYYDDFGRIELVGYFDENGASVNWDLGYSKIAITYAPDGSQQTISFLNGQAEPTRIQFPYWDEESDEIKHHDGYATIIIDFDERGNERKVSYLDRYGGPVALKHCNFKLPFSSDDLVGAILPLDYERDSLIDMPYAIVETEYDTRNGVTKRAYFTVEDIPVAADACAVMYSYDDITDWYSSFYFINAVGETVLYDKEGYARCEFVWEWNYENGVERFNYSSIYYDEDRVPCVGSDGFHLEWELENELGQVYEHSFWEWSDNVDSQYNLVRNQSAGYAVVKYEYDAFGRITREEYLDENRKSVVVQKSGAATIIRKFDEWGNKVYEEFTDTNGKLLFNNRDGYAKMECFYDENGNLINKKHYDGSGREIFDEEPDELPEPSIF